MIDTLMTPTLNGRQTNDGLISQMLNVTPAMASSWLRHNNFRNRALRQRTIEKYAADMSAGKWTLHHQGIAFREDGSLADGQHRLAACVLSGATIPLMVTYGLSDEGAGDVDGHAQRGAHDQIILQDRDSWIGKIEAVAAVRMMMTTMGSRSVVFSKNEIVQYATDYEPHIRLALDLTRTAKKNLSSAGIAANYACASIHGVSQDTITRFSEIVYDGLMTSPNEGAAVRLRNYLILTENAWGGGTRRHATSRRVQRAIQLFDEGISVKKLYEPDALIYPPPVPARLT
jgi:hypothetical protein